MNKRTFVLIGTSVLILIGCNDHKNKVIEDQTWTLYQGHNHQISTPITIEIERDQIYSSIYKPHSSNLNLSHLFLSYPSNNKIKDSVTYHRYNDPYPILDEDDQAYKVKYHFGKELYRLGTITQATANSLTFQPPAIAKLEQSLKTKTPLEVTIHFKKIDISHLELKETLDMVNIVYGYKFPQGSSCLSDVKSTANKRFISQYSDTESSSVNESFGEQTRISKTPILSSNQNLHLVNFESNLLNHLKIYGQAVLTTPSLSPVVNHEQEHQNKRVKNSKSQYKCLYFNDIAYRFILNNPNVFNVLF